MQCQHCNAILATRKSLKAHQETSKKCLTLRGLPYKKRKQKLCSEPKCGRGARAGSDKCSKHGGGKRCQEPECKASAQGKTDYCEAHGGGKRCQEPECKSSAIGKTDYCVAHGGGERCSELECGRSARAGSDKCSKHGGGKRCQEPECKASAQGKTDYCIEHGGGKRCQEPECKRGAQGKTDYCIAHGGGKRCQEPECKESAQGKTDYCIAHGGGKRCPNCKDWPDTRSGCKKYDGYCSTCFKRVFPNDPRSKVIYSHTKEIRVRNAISEYSEINKEFEGFIHDIALYTGNCDCTHRRRIDHRKMFGNTILAVETDEFCHRGYDKNDEEIRYDDLYMIHSGKWIFIRFNPDRTRTDNTDIEDRITQLLEEMETQIERIKNDENEELVEIIKMFY